MSELTYNQLVSSQPDYETSDSEVEMYERYQYILAMTIDQGRPKAEGVLKIMQISSPLLLHPKKIKKTLTSLHMAI